MQEYHWNRHRLAAIQCLCDICGDFKGRNSLCWNCRAYNNHHTYRNICKACFHTEGSNSDCPHCNKHNYEAMEAAQRIKHNYEAMEAAKRMDAEQRMAQACNDADAGDCGTQMGSKMFPVRAKLSRTARLRRRRLDKRNRRDRTKIHYPPGWSLERRAPRQHLICHRCGANTFSCHCHTTEEA